MLHAHTLKPGGFGRMHTALIDFKQVNDTIPRQELWQYLQRTSMPASFLPIIQDMHDADEYILKDGERTAQVYPNTGVKQGCPLSLLLFSLYINDVDEIAEGVQGAVTGTPGSSVTHMLYADDLTQMRCRSCSAVCTGMLRESTLLSIPRSLRWRTSSHLVQMCLCSKLGECRLHTKIRPVPVVIGRLYGAETFAP